MDSNPLPLRDIHLPDPVSWWPPAIGWYFLFALFALISLLIWAWKRYRSRFQLRNVALNELKKIRVDFTTLRDTQQLATALSLLLRRVCISRFPRQQVAGLQGEEWLNFLNTVHRSFDLELRKALIEAPYSKHTEFDADALLDACEKWLHKLPRAKRGDM